MHLALLLKIYVITEWQCFHLTDLLQSLHKYWWTSDISHSVVRISDTVSDTLAINSDHVNQFKCVIIRREHQGYCCVYCYDKWCWYGVSAARHRVMQKTTELCVCIYTVSLVACCVLDLTGSHMVCCSFVLCYCCMQKPKSFIVIILNYLTPNRETHGKLCLFALNFSCFNYCSSLNTCIQCNICLQLLTLWWTVL